MDETLDEHELEEYAIDAIEQARKGVLFVDWLASHHSLTELDGAKIARFICKTRKRILTHKRRFTCRFPWREILQREEQC